VVDLYDPGARPGDARLDAWRAFCAEYAPGWPTRYGVRLGPAAAAALATALPDAALPGIVVVAGAADAPALDAAAPALTRRGVRLYWEFAPEQAPPCALRDLAGIVIRGRECGGVAHDTSGATLFQLARAALAGVPLLVQGVAVPETAAVFLLRGARGFLLPEAAPDPERFRQDTNSVLGRLLRTAPDALRAREADPLLVQGPMAWISDSPAFAAAAAAAGFLPVLSLTGYRADQLGPLAAAARAEKALSAFGLGITGPDGFGPADVTAAFAAAPPRFLLLSGDQWPQRAAWRACGVPLWLHVQTPAMLEASLREGDRHFVFEGAESGGHVGAFASAQLWPALFACLRRAAVRDVHVVLAGGIHDADSALFAALLAAAFEVDGTLSFQLGTPLLLSPEAVATGAVAAAYQRALLDHRATAVAGGATGLRTVDASDRPAPPDPYAAYRAAVEGVADGLVLAGESIAHADAPRPLADLAASVRGYAEGWDSRRAAVQPVETLDFRVSRGRPELDMAVIGLGGIFPGAPDTAAFWTNITANTRHIADVPPEHWGPGDYRATGADRHPLLERSYAHTAGMIEDFTFDQLDCLTYHLAPRALPVTDRVHLLALKAAGETLLNAGAAVTLPADRTAVLIGNSMGGEQAKLQALRIHLPDLAAMLRSVPEFDALAPETRRRIEEDLFARMANRLPATTEDTLVGLAASTLAGRVAAYLDVRGGNFALDAACASSLAGLAAAVEMLRSGRCTAAVVGGADSDLSVGTFINFCRLHALSRTIGRPFMEGSDGFTMGEGAGLLLLKPTADALRDGDRIFARIVGVGMSSDGAVGSLTLPSADGQALAIERAFAASGFSADTIGLVEAHGTGTAAGDAAELDALHRTFRGAAPGSIALTSVKAHIGHLKSAAGAASLIKAALALHHGVRPPAWIEGTPRRELRAPETPFRLLPAAEAWHRDGFLPRRAAVSSFGFGGSNFHVHLEEMDPRRAAMTRARLLAFSGDDPGAVADAVERLAAAVETAGAVDLLDPAQFACLGGRGRCRLAAAWPTARPWSAQLAALRAALRGEPAPGVSFAVAVDRAPLVFLFPGQGSAIHAPFRQLADSVAVFAYAVRRTGTELGEDFAAALWPGDGAERNTAARLADAALQPATTALSLALVELLARLGVRPDAVAGHSLGFYAALAAAGVLDTRAALGLVRRRAACFEDLRGTAAGCMFALPLDGDRTARLAAEAPVEVFVSNLNAPNQTVVSVRGGDAAALDTFLAGRGVETQALPVAWGFHSPLMRPAAEAFATHLAAMTFRPPACALYSETVAARIPDAEFDGRHPDWLPAHIVRPVRFVDLLRRLAADGYRTTLEVGARGSLSRFARDTLGGAGVRSFTLDSTDPDVVAHLSDVLAELYVHGGIDLDLGGWADCFAGHLAPVPAGGAGRVARTAPADAPVTVAAPDEDAPAAEPGDDVYDGICAIVAQCSGFDRERIAPDQRIQETLGVDSLKMMEVGLAIERRFGIALTSGSFSRSLTVAGLAAAVRARRDTGSVHAGGNGILRRVLERRPVPPAGPADLPRGAAALVSDDAALCRAWTRRGFGPAAAIDGADAAELARALATLDLAERAGLVYAAAAGAIEAVYRPAHEIGHTVLPALSGGERKSASPFRFLTAARGPAPAARALAAWTRSLQIENPDLRCGHVTLRAPEPPAAAADLLYAELAAGAPLFRYVTAGGGQRLVDAMIPRESAGGGVCGVADDDVILATGGARGITADVVAALSAAAHPTWILAGSSDAAAEPVRRMLERLRALGCRAAYRPCDLSDRHAAADLVAWVRQRYGHPTAVLHGAGALADARLDGKPWADALRVLTVKAGAALALEGLLDLAAVRWWVNFSSIAAFAGNDGQTDYAAANAVLNEQARRLRAERGIAAVSILWGPWRERGMAAGERMQAALKTRGIATLSLAEGVAAVRNELERGTDAVVAYCGDPVAFAPPEPQAPGGWWTERRTSGTTHALLTRRLTPDEPLLDHHRIGGIPVLPGVMALELSASLPGRDSAGCTWRDVGWRRPVRAPDEGLQLRVTATADADGAAAFEIAEAGQCDAAMEGRLEPAGATPPGKVPADTNPAHARFLPGALLYGGAERPGWLFSGPFFRVLEQGVHVGGNGVRAALARERHSAAAGFRLPIAWIDGLFQMAAVIELANERPPVLPTGLAELWWSGDVPAEREATAVVRPRAGSGAPVFDGAIYVAGRPVVIAREMVFGVVEGQGEWMLPPITNVPRA